VAGPEPPTKVLRRGRLVLLCETSCGGAINLSLDECSLDAGAGEVLWSISLEGPIKLTGVWQRLLSSCGGMPMMRCEGRGNVAEVGRETQSSWYGALHERDMTLSGKEEKGAKQVAS